MLLTTHLNTIYFPKRLNLRSRTKKEMLLTVKRFSDHLGHQASVGDLTEDNVSGYLLHMIESGLSSETVKSRRGTLLTIWRSCFKKGHTSVDPAQADIPAPVPDKRVPRAWSLLDIRAMLDQAAIVQPRTESWFSSKHWTALILLIYHTGLRISAVLHLKRSDLKGHLLIVPAGIQKDREEMLIPLPNAVVSRLVGLPRPKITRHHRDLSEFLIPWPWNLKNPQDLFRNHILRPAGLPDDPKLKFHAIRRTTASIIAATHGKEIAKDTMGHSTTKVTERYIVAPQLIDPSIVATPHPLLTLPELGSTG